MILPIYTEEHSILHEKTQPITEVTAEIRQLADYMFETMHNAQGIGLAAPQIGQGIAMCVLEFTDPDGEESFPKVALLNPRVTWSSSTTNKLEEACLSILGVAGMVVRPDRVRVKAMNIEGETIEIEAKGLFGRALQHEIDHLNGILFTSYIPKKQLKKRETPDYPRI
jgi:peptide deformylase